MHKYRRLQIEISTYLMVFFGSSLASEDVREVDRWMEGSKESGVEDCLEIGGPSERDARYKPRVDALLARRDMI